MYMAYCSYGDECRALFPCISHSYLGDTGLTFSV